jgi:hypothetical protein
VSGSTGVADAVVLREAVGLALEEAVGLALGEAPGLAEAEALEAGLAASLSSTPRLFIPLSSKSRSSDPRAFIPLSSKPPSSSPLAAATGAKTDMANATDKTSSNHLRIVSLPFACTSTERMHHPGSYALYRFMDLF